MFGFVLNTLFALNDAAYPFGLVDSDGWGEMQKGCSIFETDRGV